MTAKTKLIWTAEEMYNKSRDKLINLGICKRAKLTNKEINIIRQSYFKAYRLGFADASNKKFLDADEVERIIEKVKVELNQKGEYHNCTEYIEGAMIALDMLKQELRG